MKSLILFVFFAAACTAEFETDRDVQEEDLWDSTEEVAVDTRSDSEPDASPEASDGLQEPDEASEADISWGDGNGEEEANEDAEEISEGDDLERAELEEALEVYTEDAGGELDPDIQEDPAGEDLREEDVPEEEPEPCGGCGEGYRCYGGICAKECEVTEDCTDRCMVGEYCHSLGVCIDGVPTDCSDLKSETVDECLDWEYGEDGEECCHICDYWRHSCSFQMPVSEGGHLIHANSLSGTFRLREPVDLFTGPCILTHVRFVIDDPLINLQLIDEDRGILATLEGSIGLCCTFLFRHPEMPDCVVGLTFPTNENRATFAYGSPSLVATEDSECLFKATTSSIETCKVCNPGAEVPEYAGCPW